MPDSVVAIPLASVDTNAPNAPPPPTLDGSALALEARPGSLVLW